MHLRCPALLRHAGRLLLAAALGTGTLAAAPGPQPRLWRLDCGSFDTKRLTNSCYLIHHNGQWMLWDAGFGAELVGHPGTDPAGTRITLRESLVSQLAQLGVKPAQVGIVALSHLHFGAAQRRPVLLHRTVPAEAGAQAQRRCRGSGGQFCAL